jgi:hypothetical protein
MNKNTRISIHMYTFIAPFAGSLHCSLIGALMTSRHYAMARQRREQQARQQDESMASSDYGSDIDPEDIEVGHVLAQIAATAPKTVPYTSVETQGVLQGRDAADICRHRSTSVEFEYDTASRRVFSGTWHISTSCLCLPSTDLLTASSAQGRATTDDAGTSVY